MTRYLLAHDLGTSGNKATLFSEDGRLVSSATAAYETHFFNQNWAEQNPEDWWTAVCDSTRHMLSQSGVDPASIAVVSFSGHMMGCLCLDRNGQPLRPHILWADQRAEKQAKQLDEALTPQRFYRL
ncbi:MAG: FGGY family carbohydrate kinase, partial [Eubacteriales bacterium]|nr:FGGY family carbohydrate kinase [Eubacteriales bacterium]